MRDELDKLQQLYGLRPGIQEQYTHSAHTQITIPWKQAVLATWVRFLGYIGFAAAIVLTAIAGWASEHDRPMLGLVCIGLLLLGALLAMAGRKPRKLLLERLESEIQDPFRDSPMIELMREMLLEREAPEPIIQTVREPVPWRVPANAKDPAEPLVKLADEWLELVEFTKLAAAGRGLTRSAWCAENKPRVRLSTGRYVTKSRWYELIATLEEWGIVTRGGDGQATDWLIDPLEAVRRLDSSGRQS